MVAVMKHPWIIYRHTEAVRTDLNFMEVSLKYAVATGCHGNAFNWTDGWFGNGQFWVVEQATDGGQGGLLGGNNELDNGALPVSKPVISNVTLIGADDGDVNNEGLKFYTGTEGDVYNMILTGFNLRGIHVQHDSTISKMTNGDLSVQYSVIDNINPYKFTSSSGNDTTTIFMLDDASYENQLATDGSLVGFLSGYIGVLDGSAFDPTVIGGWFDFVTYIGAVDPSNDWTSGWVKPL